MSVAGGKLKQAGEMGVQFSAVTEASLRKRLREPLGIPSKQFLLPDDHNKLEFHKIHRMIYLRA